jgi:Fe-Mn family superoxide dismutase
MPPYALPDLPYDVAALEPHLSAEVLELHHGKHHAAYVDGANEALEKLAAARAADTFDAIVGLEKALAFNVSGHVLHSLYWANMTPDGPQRPDGELAAAVDEFFGSYDALEAQLTAVATTVQGSGWAVLAWEPHGQRLVVEQVHDHQGNIANAADPLLVIDAWEHAYYLQYRNVKADYVDAFWQVADWRAVADRFASSRRLARRA